MNPLQQTFFTYDYSPIGILCSGDVQPRGECGQRRSAMIDLGIMQSPDRGEEEEDRRDSITIRPAGAPPIAM
ncbi:hypothetical protein MRB53_036200 [Persea americana]|uniref:Uncharacterized protein n=1 Tax=Persea americana TaxID=3435 RepID=A0ACC2K7A6_PERAE|nr:hypothetical protein MRB53_036200 [Persea americana]